MCKPLTKALHTTRVIAQVAKYVHATEKRHTTAAALLGAVLVVLDNETPSDPALRAAALAACEAVLS